MQKSAELGAEYYLDRELHRQGDRYEPWYRFHYPVHYYYDILIGLEMVTSLGFGNDARLKFALSLLKEKQHPDGKWSIDKTHPDVNIDLEEWYRAHPKDRTKPFMLEAVGPPSKMMTLRALSVLDRTPS
jgi:hypothetical protein